MNKLCICDCYGIIAGRFLELKVHVITLQGKIYDCLLLNKKKLKRHLKREKENTGLIHSFCKQVRELAYVSKSLLSLYWAYSRELPAVKVFSLAGVDELVKKYSKYHYFTWVNQCFYILPDELDVQRIELFLIDRYLYERKRHAEDAVECQVLLAAINKFSPECRKESELKQYLADFEKKQQDYFGQDLSDNSDSEDELAFQSKSPGERRTLLKRSAQLIDQAGVSRCLEALHSESFQFSRPVKTIEAHCQPSEQALIDLRKLNHEVKEQGVVGHDFLSGLATKFFIIQWRGIHYFTTQWSQKDRREHRQSSQIGLAQHSETVLKAAGFQTFSELSCALAEDAIRVKVQEIACDVASSLTDLRTHGPVVWRGFTYVDPLCLLQNWYSADYTGFSDKLAQNMVEPADVFYDVLPNAGRPFVSTSDWVHHAVLYAMGEKVYRELKADRLHPRWRKNGRSERPYSGKVYASFHPPSDYFEQAPSHVASWLKKGLLKINNLIAAERESSFLAYLPADRVCVESVMKYASFHGAYKEHYLMKYGLTKELFELFKKKFIAHAPHSFERKAIEQMLADYLCSFFEQKLLSLVAHELKSQGGGDDLS